MNWQPIETAPKDGNSILLAWVEAGIWRFAVGCWDNTFEHLGYSSRTGSANYRGGWTDYGVGSFSYEEYRELKPTHWMPLPTPPTPQSSDEGSPADQA